MRYATIRRELTEDLARALAPIRVVEEEAAVVAGLTVLVCCPRGGSDSSGWLHEFEERVILTGYDDPAPHFAERDDVVQTLCTLLYRWADTGRSWKAGKPRYDEREFIVGGVAMTGTVVRHNVFEPPLLD